MRSLGTSPYISSHLRWTGVFGGFWATVQAFWTEPLICTARRIRYLSCSLNGTLNCRPQHLLKGANRSLPSALILRVAIAISVAASILISYRLSSVHYLHHRLSADDLRRSYTLCSNIPPSSACIGTPFTKHIAPRSRLQIVWWWWFVSTASAEGLHN